MAEPLAVAQSQKWEVTRLDFWDYRHRTGMVFDDLEAAKQKADLLNKLDMDPLYCYFVERA